MADETTNRDLTKTFKDEAARVAKRRETLDTVDDVAPTFGLALSGGGIRSATFALGALQGMANAAAPDTGAATPDEIRREPHKSLLGRFDYLSTVSGGGYIGAFLCSLFVPSRLWKGTDERAAAEDAYRVLQQDPPGRIRMPDVLDRPHVRRSALAWLRENGRYLAPTSAGDMNYAIALAIRNWFSLQYVLGTFIAAAFALILFLRFAVAATWPGYAGFEQWLLGDATAAGGVTVWWSPIFAAPLLVLVVWLAPLSIAYWLTHPKRSKDDSSPARIFSEAALAALAIVAISVGVGLAAAARTAPLPHVVVPFAAAALTALGFAWHVLTCSSGRTVSYHRVVLTRHLATGLQLLIALSVLALVDTSSQSLYLAWSRDPDLSTIVSPAALAGGGVWLFRSLARLADRDAVPSLLAKIPIGLIAGIAGFLLFLVIATLWGLGFHALIWFGEVPRPELFDVARPSGGAARDRTRSHAAARVRVRPVLGIPESVEPAIAVQRAFDARVPGSHER